MYPYMVIVWVILIYKDILTDVDFGDIVGRGDEILMMVFAHIYKGILVHVVWVMMLTQQDTMVPWWMLSGR